jgi:hypothetical protein
VYALEEDRWDGDGQNQYVVTHCYDVTVMSFITTHDEVANFATSWTLDLLKRVSLVSGFCTDKVTSHSQEMSLLGFLSRLYSLDTLDTRFTHSSRTPVRNTANNDVDISKPRAEESKGKKNELNLQPSRWNTPEYYFYYLVFVTMIPLIFYVPYSVSKG